jgi:sugar phosphate isomerase/epimerase/ribosomal protein S18 acetylase RimI-like enzyme
MRRLSKRDSDILGTLFERNNREEVTRGFHPFPMTRETAAELLQPGRQDHFFGAEADGQLVAFSMLRGWDEGFKIPSFGIFVDYEKQQCGVGRKLTEWTLRWMDLLKCPQARLTVSEGNAVAKKMYESLGFEQTERRQKPNGDICIVMHRPAAMPALPVYVSSQCLSVREPLQERLDKLYDAGLHQIELSNYPVKDESEFFDWLREFPGRLMLHHFFPPTSDRSFVLNLASANDDVRNKTFAFFQRAVDWSAACGAAHYSIHAGYAAEPMDRNEHGFIFPMPTEQAREEALFRYSLTATALARYAQDHGVMLLIENNVVTEHNKGKLLLATPDEFKAFLQHWPVGLPLGILLDWGHWQITASTLNQSIGGFGALKEHIRGLHLHTNDCQTDHHFPFIPAPNLMGQLRELQPDFITLEGHYPALPALQTAVFDLEREFA